MNRRAHDVGTTSGSGPRQGRADRRRRYRGVHRTVAAVLVGLLLVVGIAPAASAGSDADHDDLHQIVMRVEPGSTLPTEVRESMVVWNALVASRGLFISDPIDRKAAKEVAKELEKEDGVLWASEFRSSQIDDERLHAWPTGFAQIVDVDRAGEIAEWGQIGEVRAASVGTPGLEGIYALGQIHEVTRGEGVTVAVLDTGIDRDHPMLRDRVVAEIDYLDDDLDAAEERDGIDNDGDGHVDEAFGHGTHVAGIIAQVAPDADIVAMRVLDADGLGDQYRIAVAIEDAVASGVDIINMSFGADDKDGVELVKEAIKDATKAGVVVVAAAGNERNDRHTYPGNFNGVLTVTATEAGGTMAAFAKFGKWIDVAAVGVDVMSAYPGGGYATWSGTSMAVPVVSGQAALFVAASDRDKPKDRAKDAIKAIRDSARKMSGKDRPDKGQIDIVAGLARLLD